MPISDLLNQISGGQAKNPAAPALGRSNTVPTKRKAEGYLGTSAPKTARVTQPAPRPSTDRPATINRTQNGAVTKPNSSSTNRPTSNAKPAAAAPVAARPPKKGSFAEILARGQRAQATMGQVGKIQHKKVEGMPRKPRDEAQPSPGPRAKKGTSSGYAGTAKATGSRPGTNGSSQRSDGRAPIAGARKPGSLKKAREPEPEPEKKMKKAAAATTGYTGTARPKPGAASNRPNAPRGGALLNVPTHRSGSRKSRYEEEEEEEEEMDDFIEYDDDEDEQGYGRGGPRYDYASDGSSDMEAGMDEVYGEEQRAARIARQEDIEEERREMSLKAAKEERKRKALEGLRANRRS